MQLVLPFDIQCLSNSFGVIESGVAWVRHEIGLQWADVIVVV